MLQQSALRRPFKSETLIYNWFEERADVKNERVQKPLPSQVVFPYLHFVFTTDIFLARSLLYNHVRM